MHSPLERLILETWASLQPQLLKSRDELNRRLRRSKSRTFSSPPRAWCLAVRACDRRIGIRNGQAEPEHAVDPHDPSHPGRMLQHTITLTDELVRDLCAPVTLTPGGELPEEAAKKLGATRSALNHPRISGALQTRHVKGLLARHGHIPIVSTPNLLDPSAGRDFQVAHPLWIGHEYVSARVPRNLCQTLTRIPIYAPIVSPHQYDPNAHPELANPPKRTRKRLPPPAPDYVWYKWSTAGEFLGEDPRYWRKSPSDPGHPPPPGSEKSKRKRPHQPKPSRATGSLVFRGWRWICPKCGKKVRTVYLPAPPKPMITLSGNPKFEARAVEPAQPDNPKQITNPNAENSKPASGIPSFDHSDLFRIVRLRRLNSADFGFRASDALFACARCHYIRGFSTVAPNSWNELVSYFTSGLLRGSDIPKPDWFIQSVKRKLTYRPRIRAAPRREQLLKLVLQGRTSRQISIEMNLALLDVCGRIWQLCRDEQVPDRLALARKYGVSPDLQPDRIGRTRRRRDRVRELLIQGRTYEQIASELKVKREIIWHDVHYLCREAGVKGREGLMRKHRDSLVTSSPDSACF